MYTGQPELNILKRLRCRNFFFGWTIHYNPPEMILLSGLIIVFQEDIVSFHPQLLFCGVTNCIKLYLLPG